MPKAVYVSYCCGYIMAAYTVSALPASNFVKRVVPEKTEFHSLFCTIRISILFQLLFIIFPLFPAN